MGIAVFSRSPLRSPARRSSVLSVLLSPLQAFASFLRPAQPAATLPAFVAAARHPAAGGAENATKTIAAGARHTTAASQKPCQTLVKATSPRRLKIVRELEAGVSPACAGRMVISGRMADVCAELDRMAQREAALHVAC